MTTTKERKRAANNGVRRPRRRMKWKLNKRRKMQFIFSRWKLFMQVEKWFEVFLIYTGKKAVTVDSWTRWLGLSAHATTNFPSQWNYDGDHCQLWWIFFLVAALICCALFSVHVMKSSLESYKNLNFTENEIKKNFMTNAAHCACRERTVIAVWMAL